MLRFLIFLHAALVVVFVVLQNFLPVPPNVYKVDETLVGVLLLIMGAALSSLWWQLANYRTARLGSKAVTVVLFALAAMLGMVASYPTSKTMEEAIVLNAEREEAANAGIELGEQVQAREISLEEAKEMIATDFNTDAQATALEALEVVTAEPDLDRAEVLTKSFPTVPMALNTWTCNETGCSFADESHVWTISSQSLVLGRFLSFAALALMWWVCHGVVVKNFLNDKNGKRK